MDTSYAGGRDSFVQATVGLGLIGQGDGVGGLQAIEVASPGSGSGVGKVEAALMWVEVIGIEDVVARQVRTNGDFGELVVTWLDVGDPLPSPGEVMDVEVTLGLDEANWDNDIVLLDAHSSVAIEEAEGEFNLTGWAEWSKGDHILWLRLATDCLMSIVLDREFGDTRTIGMVRLRARALYFCPTGI